MSVVFAVYNVIFNELRSDKKEEGSGDDDDDDDDDDEDDGLGRGFV